MPYLLSSAKEKPLEANVSAHPSLQAERRGTYKKAFRTPKKMMMRPSQRWILPNFVGACVLRYSVWWRKPSTNWPMMKATMMNPRIW